MKKLITLYVLLIILTLLVSPTVINRVKLQRELEQYLYLNRLNPTDYLIRKRILRFCDKNGIDDNQLIPLKNVNKFNEATKKDSEAVHLARELDNKTKSAADISNIGNVRRYAVTHELSELMEPEHDDNYFSTLRGKLLSTRKPVIFDIDYVIPNDKIYLRFRNYRVFYDFLEYFDKNILPALKVLYPDSNLFSLKKTLEIEFDLNLDRLLEKNDLYKMNNVALLLDDFDYANGKTLTLIFMFKDQDMTTRFLKRRKLYSYDKYKNIEHEPVSRDRFFIFSTAAAEQGRILEIIDNNSNGSLAHSDDYLYFASIQNMKNDMFAYASEGFVRKVASAEHIIKNNRRDNCLSNLYELNTSYILFESGLDEFIIPEAHYLYDLKYISYDPTCLDGGEYKFSPITNGFECSVHGGMKRINNIDDIKLGKISGFEMEMYEDFKKVKIGSDIHLEPVSISLNYVDLPHSNFNIVTAPDKRKSGNNIVSIASAIISDDSKVRGLQFFRALNEQQHITSFISGNSNVYAPYYNPQLKELFKSPFSVAYNPQIIATLETSRGVNVLEFLSNYFFRDDACARNLAYLQNLYELFTMHNSDMEPLIEELAFDKYYKAITCCAGGKYSIENGVVACSIHGTAHAIADGVVTPMNPLIQALADDFTRSTAGIQVKPENLHLKLILVKSSSDYSYR